MPDEVLFGEPSLLTRARRAFHYALIEGGVLCLERPSKPKKGIPELVPSNSDSSSATSVALAIAIYEQLYGEQAPGGRLAGQISGNKFEQIVRSFVEQTFLSLQNLRPGTWEFGHKQTGIHHFEQYRHLADLAKIAEKTPELSVLLGSDYLITPDIVIMRQPEPDEVINQKDRVVDDSVATRASLRKKANEVPILHASISCKWTLRSDRAQNARSEALNLVRNRKGRLPHIVLVTAEPSPGRLASISLGTGDLDCVYHFALPELEKAVQSGKNQDSAELLRTMVEGKRLKDISDLPLDLAI